ncbi:hypothetical protein, partial [Enterobacter sp. Bisph1]|uniref:hypothetical protein n=1 Tax=Enterobacter sp. Bisph1 TaxID=1274399 RepID=UPI001E47F8DF
GNRCFALRSPPAHLPAVGSTRHPWLDSPLAAIRAASPCHLRSGSPISAGTHPLAAISLLKWGFESLGDCA